MQGPFDLVLKEALLDASKKFSGLIIYWEKTKLVQEVAYALISKEKKN